jgi:hypothetical protein
MIIVATHKEFDISSLPSCYEPVHVGAELSNIRFGYSLDNQGDSISGKNKNYCELTGLYWLWKNNSNSLDFYGLSHYRRFFSKSDKILGFLVDKGNIIDREFIKECFLEFDIILPKKRFYPFTTVKQQYSQSHSADDLRVLKTIIEKSHPNFLDSFNKVISSRSLHLYNMFVMKKNVFNDYCSWLFSILEELEAKLDISAYDQYQARLFGFLAERLLNIWVHKNSLRVKELYVYEPEGKQYINKSKKYLLEFYKSQKT